MLHISNFIKNIITDIYVPEKFGINLDDDWSDNFDAFVSDIENNYAGAEVCHGVSKAVIVAKDEDIVVKVPFQGYYESYEENEEDFDEQFGVFYPNEGANNKFNNWDYCQLEVEEYEKAKAHHVGNFFAEVQKVEHGCYIQEKCECFCVKNSGVARSENSMNASNRLRKKYHVRFNSLFIADCVEYYGEEATDNFLAYVYEYGIDEDMHDSNYGYATADGRPVLIDYSGWWD